MAAWNILVTDTLDQQGLDILASQAILSYKPDISPQALQVEIYTHDALIVRSRTQVTLDIITAANRLKVIGRAGVGVDNIDLKSAAAHGVTVVNTPTATSTAVAEHTIGLVLALARQIPAADASMKMGKWEKKHFKGVELGGKTLGILGLGNIGSRVVQYAAALGMHVLGHDPHHSPEQIRTLGAVPVTFKDLLTRADFISLHPPLTTETLNLFTTEQFLQMKPGAYLICTARGGMIDEEALAAALNSGQLAGAALDVFATEPPPPNSISNHPAVLATPHIASQTVEAQIRAAVSIAEEVLSVLQGYPARWQVKLPD